MTATELKEMAQAQRRIPANEKQVERVLKRYLKHSYKAAKQGYSSICIGYYFLSDKTIEEVIKRLKELGFGVRYGMDITITWER